MARFGFSRAASGEPLDLDFEPLGLALDALERAGASVAAEVMPAIAENLVFHVQEVFEREGAVAGNSRWKELAKSTLAARRKKGAGAMILQDSGFLAGSITAFSEAIVAEAFTNVPYAGFHVSKAPRKKIPLRDFTAIDFELAQKEACDLILEQLESNAGRAA